MSIFYSITVSNEKEGYNSEVKKLVSSENVSFSIDNTKDGTIYQLEFSNDNQLNKFKEKIQKALPFLF